MHTTHLLYLHGFRSSPQSTKAERLAEWLVTTYPDVVWACPALEASPTSAMAQIAHLVADWPPTTSVVMGSSLGGLYASFIAHARGWPSVVINPAVTPWLHGDRLVGTYPMWHDPTQTMTFSQDDLAALQDLALAACDVPTNTLAIVAKGDEVLDWREMAQHYEAADLRLLEGGDHALSDFEPWLAHIAAFLSLKST